jgi:hypothetical protein
VGGDLFEYINFQQRYDIDARIQRALKRSKEYLEPLPAGAAAGGRASVPKNVFGCYVPAVFRFARLRRSAVLSRAYQGAPLAVIQSFHGSYHQRP